jgi:hypothetical protein
MHRFYIYSNLRGFVPKPTIKDPKNTSAIIAGGFGRVNCLDTWKRLGEMCQTFPRIFWVPGMLELGDLLCSPYKVNSCMSLDMNKSHLENITIINNNVITFKGIKMVGSPCFKPDRNPHYASEDFDFIKSEATADALVIAASHIPLLRGRWVIHGTPPTGENFTVSNDTQMHISNSREAVGFNENYFLDINCSSSLHRDME